MSYKELQIVSPRADNAYSGKVLEVDGRAPCMTMFRRVPIKSYYPPPYDDIPVTVAQDTFTRRSLPVSRTGDVIEVLCDDDATCRSVIEHLLARDREYRHWEEKYGYYFDSWRQNEKAGAEKKFMEAAHENYFS